MTQKHLVPLLCITAFCIAGLSAPAISRAEQAPPPSGAPEATQIVVPKRAGVELKVNSRTLQTLGPEQRLTVLKAQDKWLWVSLKNSSGATLQGWVKKDEVKPYEEIPFQEAEAPLKRPLGNGMMQNRASNVRGRTSQMSQETAAARSAQQAGPPLPQAPQLKRATMPDTTVFQRREIAQEAPIPKREVSSGSPLLDRSSQSHVASAARTEAAEQQKNGNFQAARTRLAEALAQLEAASQAETVEYGLTLRDLGLLDQDACNYILAEQSLNQAQQLMQKLGQAEESAILDGLLASLYYQTGDYERCGRKLQECLELHARLFGRNNDIYSSTIHNLGLLAEKQGDRDAALKWLKEDLEISRGLHGEQSVQFAHCASNMGLFEGRRGNVVEGISQLEKSLQIFKAQLGDKHPTTATTLENLGYVQLRKGELSAAEESLQRALDIRREVLGGLHLDVADSLQDLALLREAQGLTAEAFELFNNSLEITRQQLLLASYGQSERQQLAMAAAFRARVDAYLSMALRCGQIGASEYQQILTLKGAIFSRQRCVRLARKSEAYAAKFAQLRRISSELSTLVLNVPEEAELPEWRARIEGLLLEKEALEGSVASTRGGFRPPPGAPPPPSATAAAGSAPPEVSPQFDGIVTAQQVQQQLSPGSALIDFIEFENIPSPLNLDAQPEREFGVFVVRPGQDVVFLPLGSARRIAKAYESWSSSFSRTQPVTGSEDDATVLRQLIWDPISPYLVDASTILISPDGIVSRIPFAALPGDNPDKYLIEEKAFALIPVPRLLPGSRQDAANPNETQGLLALGAVDFDQRTDAPPTGGHSQLAMRAGGMQQWSSLPATRAEIVTIRDSFETRFPDDRVRMLRGAEATEDVVSQQMEKCRFLHLATHGFFSPPDVKSALVADGRRGQSVSSIGYHPGLMSGIVLAGANLAPEPGRGDGILTALEVAELDLTGVELATLSACETGLGELAAGEGVLGLQRAFQVAGARSTITTLWKIRDDATQDLMIHFYDNLWNKQMSKAEALRQAQLALLENPAYRGLIRENKPQTGRTPPSLWAAFLVSGDWE
ncbi:CHAT domain-containing protein [Planctomicrobium sp. SH664]|uniref:CHAT domain-containing protein n=1 Tax=Planctomicrobium sp. SH664 TaxID=3448125 RepID=UPI003F5C6431